MRVFIAGATGAIGKRAVRQFIAAGHAVTGVARSPAGRAALERDGATAVELDLFDLRAVRRSIEGHEAVINVATHIPRGRIRVFLRSAWAETDRLRSEASANLADAAVLTGARVFVQESFAFTYPDGGDAWVTEETNLEPTRYNRTVRDAEASAERFAQSGGRGAALRFAAFYGPGDFNIEQILAAVKYGFFPVLGRAEGYFPMVHHDDAASAVVAALNAPSGAYNVVDNEPLRRRELARVMADLLGVREPRLPPSWLSSLSGPVGKVMSRSLRLSNQKMRSAGWTASFPTAVEGLRPIVAAMQSRRTEHSKSWEPADRAARLRTRL